MRIWTRVGVVAFGVLVATAGHAIAADLIEKPASAIAALEGRVPTTAEDFEGVVGTLASRRIPLVPEQVDRLAAVVDEVAGAQCGVRVDFARAVVAWRQQDLPRARELIRAVAKAEPGNAEYQTTLGTILFQSIIGQRDLGALRIAEEGVAAYERAIEIDPTLVEPRIGLGLFAAAAPGFAGGSYRKARAQAETLGRIEGGEYAKRVVLAEVAKQRERWDEMSAEFVAAEALGGNAVFDARLAHAQALLAAKKDASAALTMVDRAVELSPEGHPFRPYALAVRGQALLALDRVTEARADLEESARLLTPTASVLFALSQAREREGDRAAARAGYELMVAKFGNVRDASEAKRAIRRLDRG
jgi:predicted Zn-dependent protease